MKRILIFSSLILILILTGCKTDNLKNENKNLVSRLDEANRQIQDLTKDKEILSSKIDDLTNTKKQFNKTITSQKQLENELNWYKSVITDIMNLKDFQYEVVSQAINREPYDKVIYIKNVPDLNKDQRVYLLKAAFFFSNDDAKLVTFWRDRNKAILYRDGKYNSDESPLGWSGFDYRFGSILNDGKNSYLRQYNSIDDSQLIEFGKYTSKQE